MGAFAVASVAFFLVALVPSDPARAVLGDLAAEEQIAQFNTEHGLSAPLLVRYGRFVADLFHGSLGESYYSGGSVLQESAEHYMATLEIVVLGLVVALVVGIALGALGAYFRGTPADSASRSAVAVLQAIPDYVVGLLGALVLVYALPLLPVPLGQLGPAIEAPPRVTGAAFVDALLAGQLGAAWQAATQMVLPVLSVGLFSSVMIARTVRASLAEALTAPDAEFARALGLPAFTVARMALRATVLPLVSITGVVVGTLVGGSAIVELTFSWDGFGQWAIEGITRSDLPVTVGFVLISGVLVLLTYTLSDVLMTVLDPRQRRVRPADRPAGAAPLASPTGVHP
ncbi:peptide ABC transporter permease [Nocardia jinanensis]|uniref:Peptide ABC transporter permease n=1 Tax=Nocardia jinanensis TaxID=382504 RepID=A0A917RBM8_9NOCA|nr:peptide ABC transporter permease [Nocardia jinanensis]